MNDVRTGNGEGGELRPERVMSEPGSREVFIATTGRIAPTDTERLDWLEKTESINCYDIVDLVNAKFCDEKYHNMRDAIDAAMNAEKERESR